MPRATITPIKDTAQDKDFLAQIYAYAERKAVDGVLIQRIQPVKGQRALIIVALGDQADELDAVILTNIVTERDVIESANRFGF